MSRTDLHAVPSIEHADPSEADTLGALIATAFHHLPPAVWLVGDPVELARILPDYFTMFVEHAFAVRGRVFTTRDRSAVGVWFDAALVPLEAQLPQGYEARLVELTGGRFRRFRSFDLALDAVHPTAPHWYLAFLAVHPHHQGRGLGSALLRHTHAELDDGYHAAYLEAAAPRNRDLYARHGYRQIGPAVVLPDGGPSLWPMLRRPRPDNPPIWAIPHR